MQVGAGVEVRKYVRHDAQMRRTATDFRAHLYEVLDHVAKTGEPVYVTRRGVELCIVRQAAAPQKRKKPRVIPRLIVGDPDALIHVEWPWSEGREL
jgi:antitoxin (DNA-binding transcriptional repressor) of toxin-antitoxin stability system